MSDISKIIIPGGDDYNIKDGLSISNITRSGDTFTAMRRNGTSFTFTQGHQDISGKLNTSLKGANNGLAELDANGKVPTSQLPSYVDDVIEANGTTNFPSTGETGKIYVDTSTNKTYRWSGTTYTEISASLALGTTSSTAFRGDYGNSAYAHAVTNKGAAFASGLYKITTNAEGHVTAATAVAKADITGLGIPASDTNTHRPIQVNGTEVLGNNTTALNLKAGSNVTLGEDSGTVTISATDTTYSPATATPGNVSTTGAVGTSTAYARGDHVHAISLATGDSNGQVKVAGSNVAVKGLQDGAYVNAPRYVNLGSVSTLPGTWTVAGITTNMVCSQAILSNPAAQTGDWTVNTNTAGQITVSGSISGTTTVTLVMVPSISVTGVKK